MQKIMSELSIRSHLLKFQTVQIRQNPSVLPSDSRCRKKSAKILRNLLRTFSDRVLSVNVLCEFSCWTVIDNARFAAVWLV